jgi:hypothetical protein
MMDYQKSHPEKFYYTRSRFFTFTEDGSSEENWMFLDEYDNREDPEIVKLMDDFFPKWNALIISGSKKKGELWTEAEKLRVEFK